MNPIVRTERATQDRVIALFRDELGYRFLGSRSDRDNSNVEEDLLTAHLVRAGYGPEHISRAVHRLRTGASDAHGSLYENNRAA